MGDRRICCYCQETIDGDEGTCVDGGDYHDDHVPTLFRSAGAEMKNSPEGEWEYDGDLGVRYVRRFGSVG